MTAAAPVSALPRLGALCVVRDGRFVEPCAALARAPFVLLQALDPRTRTPERSFVAVLVGGGFEALPSCPFCRGDLPGGAS